MRKHMTMKLKIIFLILSLVSPVVRATEQTECTGESAPIQSSPDIRIELSASAEERSVKLASVRDWIWSHWRDHLAGQRTLTMYSVEGQESRSRILICRDQSDSWHIKYHIDRYAGRIPEGSNEFNVYSVDRLRRPLTGDIRGKPAISADSILRPMEYVLVFRDKEGKILREF